MVSRPQSFVGWEMDRVERNGPIAGLSEGELLERFVARRDELAFEALIARHGRMVLGVCHRLLGDPHSAADAFQATFLVLVRRAGSLRDADLLGPWLHGVALKVARRARIDAARRRDRESRGVRPEASVDHDPLEGADLQGILDQELNRLPERYRRPIILCDLQGETQDEAARRLRCTSGMLRGRLDRGRQKLRARLTRRGLAPSVALMGGPTAAPSLSQALVRATASASLRAAPGGSALAAVLGPGWAHGTGLPGRLPFAVAGAVLALTGVSLLVTLRGAVPSGAGRPPDPSPPMPLAGAIRDGIDLAGRVVNLAGRPVAGARVGRGADRRAGGAEAFTDTEGRFAFRDVPRGATTLTVQATGHAPELLDLDGTQPSPPIEVRLGPGRSIRGRITDLTGQPIAGAPITVGPWRGRETLDWQTVTDADGRYRWDDAPRDEVLIDLGTMGYTSRRFLAFPPATSERDLTMPRPRFVRGKVTDAATGQPIDRFTVLTGHRGPTGGPLEWEYPHATPGSGGAYEAKLGAEYRDFDRFVRIEAEGYRPEQSRPLGEGEAEWDRTIDLQLNPGEAVITGVVRLPDGSPAVGAEVALVATPTMIDDGRFAEAHSGRRARTGADGRFRFPALIPPFAVVVVHDVGSVVRTSGELADGTDLILRPWGRVEGTYRVGSRPGTGARLTLSRSPLGPSQSLVQFGGHATVDPEGHFAFGHVADGGVVVAQMVRHGTFGTLYPLTDPLSVAPGGTATVPIGGTSRPVVGRLDLPAPVAAQADWTRSEILLVSRQEPKRTRVGTRSPDGTFRVEDVPAGSHELIIEIKRSPAEGNAAFSDQPIAVAQRRIEVPAIPGGRSDEPLDIGHVAPLPRE